MAASSPDVLMTVAKYASDNDIPFGFNFGATFLFDDHSD